VFRNLPAQPGAMKLCITVLTAAVITCWQAACISAFTFVAPSTRTFPRSYSSTPSNKYAVSVITPTALKAGGFEWEDPEDAFDQAVDNPFKNVDSESETPNDDGLKVDPARLLGPRLEGCNLYFIGMMGSGKTAVGDIVAKRIGTYNFLDTDNIIESVTGATIPEIFESEGEDGFRDIESQVLDSVYAYVRCVVSTGGGLVCRLLNWSKLQSGVVVWLDVKPDVIMKRIQGTDRPLLQTDDPLTTLTELLQSRLSRYEQADVTIDVTEQMDASDVADAVIKQLHNFIDENPPAWLKAKAKAQDEGLDWVK